MSRVAVKINLTPDEQARLVKIVRSGKSEARLVQRAQIILACAQGLENQTVAKQSPLNNSQPFDIKFKYNIKQRPRLQEKLV